MNAVHINFLEEFKYVDKICREMYIAENGVSAYIDQMDATPIAVRYRITGWDDDYKRLKHIRWLRNQIAHNTEYVECTQADLDWLKAFHNRLLTQQDPLAMAYRVTREAQQNKPQKLKTPPTVTREINTETSGSLSVAIKAIIVIAIIAAVAVLAGVLIWSMTR